MILPYKFTCLKKAMEPVQKVPERSANRDLPRSRSFLNGLIVAASFLLTLEGAGVQQAQAANVQSLMAKDIIKWQGSVLSIEKFKHYYRESTAEGIWTNDSGLNRTGKQLQAMFHAAHEDGLDARDYLSVFPEKTGGMSAEEAARFEMALSGAFLRFCRDIYSGRSTPSVTDPDIVIERKPLDIAGWLEMARQEGPQKVLEKLRPPHPQYNQLRQMLAGYSQLAASGGWPEISSGRTLKKGMSDPRVGELRANMTGRGYRGLASEQSDLFDDHLARVVSHFQRRNGLEDDGIVGPATAKALNIPADLRVKQIVTNMERWRWLPRDLGDTHIMVNQAAFSLYLRHGEEVIDSRRVVIGKPYHQSPMFSDKLRYLEFNPTWTVPGSIAGREMLPKIRANPGYLAANHYLLYNSWAAGAKPINPHSINWSNVSSTRFPYRIVQQPGSHNALGRVKFMFPNKFAVYLHDTPSKALFSRARRAFSHGCIRVYKPLDFAAELFSISGGLTRSEMDEILAAGKTKRVNLKNPIPIHLAYFTVWVRENGIPSFYEDIYERDYLVGRIIFGGS